MYDNDYSMENCLFANGGRDNKCFWETCTSAYFSATDINLSVDEDSNSSYIFGLQNALNKQIFKIFSNYNTQL